MRCRRHCPPACLCHRPPACSPVPPPARLCLRLPAPPPTRSPTLLPTHLLDRRQRTSTITHSTVGGPRRSRCAGAPVPPRVVASEPTPRLASRGAPAPRRSCCLAKVIGSLLFFKKIRSKFVRIWHWFSMNEYKFVRIQTELRFKLNYYELVWTYWISRNWWGFKLNLTAKVVIVYMVWLYYAHSSKKFGCL
jgi:hypothetical protein